MRDPARAFSLLLSLRLQTPPASRKRKGDEEEDNLITIEKPYYDGLIELASVALFEACYCRTKPEVEEWVKSMNKK